MWSRKRQTGLNGSKFAFGSGIMDRVFQQNGGEAQDHARRDECFDDPCIAPATGPRARSSVPSGAILG